MTGHVDAFTLEILSNAFRLITEEMAVVEYRSSFSPVIREEHDFNTVLLDRSGNLVAASEQNPSMLGVMQTSLKWLIEERGHLQPGDTLIANHPYKGGSHTPDIQIFTPAYLDRELIGYAGAIAHHLDIGGRFVGTENPETTELYQEGLVFPGVLLVDAHRRVESVYQMISANVRDPRSTLGDLDAQVAACRIGAGQLVELCERFGLGTVRSSMQTLLDQTAGQARAIFESWPVSATVVDGYLDNGGPELPDPQRIRVSARAEGGRLYFDLDGTVPQFAISLNVPYANTLAAIYYAVREFTDLPMNEGLTRQIEVSVPEGCMLNPTFPAPTVSRFMGMQRLASATIEALGALRPQAAVAGSSVCAAAFFFESVDPRTGRRNIFTDYFGGGGGAGPAGPGDHAIDAHTANCAMVPIEICESEFPWRIECSELVDGSGGTGKHPGGMGLHRVFRLLADTAAGMCNIDQTTEIGRAHGLAGGGDGQPASFILTRAATGEVEHLTGRSSVTMAKGDVLSLTTSGGGGYGRADE